MRASTRSSESSACITASWRASLLRIATSPADVPGLRLNCDRTKAMFLADARSELIRSDLRRALPVRDAVIVEFIPDILANVCQLVRHTKDDHVALDIFWEIQPDLVVISALRVFEPLASAEVRLDVGPGLAYDYRKINRLD